MTTITTNDRAAKKAEREWKRTKANAKVYVALDARLPRVTEEVRGEEILAYIKKEAWTLIARGKKSRDNFIEKLQQNAVNALEWSHTPFDELAAMRVGEEVLGMISAWSKFWR